MIMYVQKIIVYTLQLSLLCLCPKVLFFFFFLHSNLRYFADLLYFCKFFQCGLFSYLLFLFLYYSVLESDRMLLLAERVGGGEGDSEGEVEKLEATEGFQVFATMNPGGDFGKKEVKTDIAFEVFYLLFCCIFVNNELLL